MDFLVKPSKPIANYLKEIIGVTIEELGGVTCNLKFVQVVNLCINNWKK